MPSAGGVLRRVDRDVGAVEQEAAGVGAVDAGETLHERRLAGAVVADQRGDLAGVDREVDVVQHVHRAEALVDAGASSTAPRCRWPTR